jgi:hypothetical protein
MGRTCNRLRRDREFIQNFGQETSMKKQLERWEDTVKTDL